MRKLTMTLTAVMLMLGTMVMTASAQTQERGCVELPRAASVRDAVRQTGGL